MTSKQASKQSVTISIVSHAQQAMVLPLLEQLDRHCQGVVANVVLTINVAEENLVSTRKWKIPLTLLTNARPLGFGANHNTAFELCKTPWFLVLNPDIRLRDDVLSHLISSAPEDAALVAPRIQEPSHVAPTPHRGLLTPIEIWKRRHPSHQPPLLPAWIPGMFMLFRSEAYRQINGFDPRFFMYGEDFDICARLRLAGWQLRTDEGTTVLHEAQRDSHRKFRPLYWHLSSLAKIWLSPTFWRYRALLLRASKSTATI
ncbi:glycosyltransferase [Paracidovorax wautersii]|uniref:N-acetylglucosaminyl-diphospho-decaprenol L-rhamnosyltransferase n=1 Tax=Paracidovorax wautersii TaxID=1177982 RepID=A0ABU1I8J9_9BURK|nr:glycosyltransferase [Paracidovorax wautersii]MDR6212828.1 N-acetylglucosaminyl-diphospho-decaprenol L-rhamnosyltransferase [Paracidovorax wautersii]